MAKEKRLFDTDSEEDEKEYKVSFSTAYLGSRRHCSNSVQ
jgi:hypothetical protein